MYSPKPKNPFIWKPGEQNQWNERTVRNLLRNRRMLTGYEASQIMQMKPIGSNLDVLYLTVNQIPDGLYVKIADEFGNHVAPELNKTVRADEILTPKAAIKICQDTFGFDSTIWNDGIFILTCNRSDCVQKIYAAEHEYLAARTLGMTAITDNQDKLCVYADNDVFKRFNQMITAESEEPVTLPDEMQDLVQLLEQNLTSLCEIQPTGLANKDLDEYENMSKNTQEIFKKMKTKFESDTANNENNIRNLERTITVLRENNENLAEEMELELQTVTAEYDKRISDLHRQTKTEQKKEVDEKKVIEMQEKIESLKNEIATIQRSTPNDNNISTQDVVQLLGTDAHDESNVIATMTTKEASSLIPKWNNAENIISFCKKIESAHAFCSAEGYNEEKFCQILRLHLPETAAQVYDQLDASKKKSVTEITSALLSRLDRQENEYLQEFAKLKKEPLENHNTFALRVQRMYELGTGSDGTMTSRDKKLICECFLSGLSLNEQTALRLVATDSEMSDIQALARRASRSAITQTNVNAVSNKTDTKIKHLPDKQEIQSPKKPFRCYFCKRPGHGWRRCYKRARVNPEWKPHYESKVGDTSKTEA